MFQTVFLIFRRSFPPSGLQSPFRKMWASPLSLTALGKRSETTLPTMRVAKVGNDSGGTGPTMGVRGGTGGSMRVRGILSGKLTLAGTTMGVRGRTGGSLRVKKIMATFPPLPPWSSINIPQEMGKSALPHSSGQEVGDDSAHHEGGKSRK